MIQAVTGSGKTLLALNAAGRLEQSLSLELRIKIVVPTNALMHQWYQALKTFLADEQMAYQDITDRMNYLFSNLLKTTPYLKNLSTRELFEVLRSLSGDKNPKIAESASLYLKLSFQRKGLVCLAASRVSCACELVNRLPQTEKIIVFSERIEQAEELHRRLQKQYPGKIGRYHSQMGKVANRNVLSRFRDGSIRILIACKAVDEGLDIPDASIGVILSGTSMHRQRIQRLGRILRRSEGKERASLYYLHLLGSAEDHCFLPDTADSHVFELEYNSDIQEFSNPPYEKASAHLLAQMQDIGADAQLINEALRCLRHGIVRSD